MEREQGKDGERERWRENEERMGEGERDGERMRKGWREGERDGEAGWEELQKS